MTIASATRAIVKSIADLHGGHAPLADGSTSREVDPKGHVEGLYPFRRR